MVFSDTTTKLGILQGAEDRSSLGDTGVTGNAYLLKIFTGYVNQWNRKVWHWIFEAYGGWQYDDANQTDLPAASATLTANQTTYALPLGALSVRGVEVKDTGGVWQTLTGITEEQIRERQALGEFFKTPSSPLFYQLVGQTVRIFPASNYTQTASFKVFFDRGSVAFASTDTTATPGFVSEYHDILPIGAALEYLKIKVPGSPTLPQLRLDTQELEKNIKTYYQRKFAEMFPPRITVRDSLRENL